MELGSEVLIKDFIFPYYKKLLLQTQEVIDLLNLQINTHIIIVIEPLVFILEEIFRVHH